MLSPEQLLSFLLAAVLITAAPGPDNLMVLSIGMARGRRPGVVFGLGCAIGCLSHTLLAILGLSALIAASTTAFLIFKLCGGAYLIWLGMKALRSRGGISAELQAQMADTSAGLFAKGVLANAINPKVILFFLSFLPQFVVAEQGDVSLQLASLGLMFTLQACLLFALIGYFSGSVGGLLQGRPRIGMWLDRLAGMVFVVLGVRLIVTH